MFLVKYGPQEKHDFFFCSKAMAKVSGPLPRKKDFVRFATILTCIFFSDSEDKDELPFKPNPSSSASAVTSSTPFSSSPSSSLLAVSSSSLPNGPTASLIQQNEGNSVGGAGTSSLSQHHFHQQAAAAQRLFDPSGLVGFPPGGIIRGIVPPPPGVAGPHPPPFPPMPIKGGQSSAPMEQGKQQQQQYSDFIRNLAAKYGNNRE